MPPVAAVPVIRTNGKTARDAYMRPLQTCRKYHINTKYCNNKKCHPVGAVIDRPGKPPGKSTLRANCTGSPLQPNRQIASTTRFPGGVGSPRPTGQRPNHCPIIKMCPQSGHTKSELSTLNSPLCAQAQKPLLPDHSGSRGFALFTHRRQSCPAPWPAQ